ncbi:MAG: MauE/DoxX family redox-associated membrane protein [Acidimicrobiales bacterium]
MIGPYLIACTLLVLAGASKALRPANTVRGLAAVFGHRDLLAMVVPLVAGGELLLGVAALAWPAPALAIAVAASYASFAVVVLILRNRGGALASCGCFGTPDTPATGLHAIINAALAAACAVIAALPPGHPITTVLARQPLSGVPLVLAVAVGTWLVVLVFTSLARLSAVRRTLAATPGTSGGLSS